MMKGKMQEDENRVGARALKAIFAAATLCFGILVAVAVFNFRVDPMCFYRCKDIDLDKRTVNHFYQVAQKILAHPETELVIVGSSRGQTTSPLWIQEKTGLKTLNLSIGAAELTAKLAFLNIALEHAQIKKVLWYADFFELMPETADAKIRSTPALRAYLESDLGKSNGLSVINDGLKLIDHNTLEASYYSLKNAAQYSLDQGSASQVDFHYCMGDQYRGERSRQQLEKENGITYDTYTRKVLKYEQSPEAWNSFIRKLEFLSAKNINVLIVVPPYNPDFSKRLVNQYPEIYASHRKWIEKLRALKIRGVNVVDYFEGIPHDDGSPRYWNDGVHFTCRGVAEMLDQSLILLDSKTPPGDVL